MSTVSESSYHIQNDLSRFPAHVQSLTVLHSMFAWQIRELFPRRHASNTPSVSSSIKAHGFTALLCMTIIVCRLHASFSRTGKKIPVSNSTSRSHLRRITKDASVPFSRQDRSALIQTRFAQPRLCDPCLIRHHQCFVQLLHSCYKVQWARLAPSAQTLEALHQCPAWSQCSAPLLPRMQISAPSLSAPMGRRHIDLPLSQCLQAGTRTANFAGACSMHRQEKGNRTVITRLSLSIDWHRLDYDANEFFIVSQQPVFCLPSG